LVHPALFYADSEEYLSGLVPFITGGLAADEPVLVAVPEERIELLRGGLRRAADHVLFVDMTEAGRNPGRIIPRVLRAFVDQHPTRPTRVIGGADLGGSVRDRIPGLCAARGIDQHCFGPPPGQHRVPVRRLPARPHGAGRRGVDPSPAHRAGPVAPQPAVRGPRRRGARLEPAPARPPGRPHHPDLHRPRRPPPGPPGRPRGRRAGGPDRAASDELLLAVNELAVNTLLHTGRPGIFSIWRDQGQIVCQVHDSGHLADPLAGRHPAAPHDEAAAYGLSLVHDVCDLVRVHTQPGGTTIRLYIRLLGAPAPGPPHAPGIPRPRREPAAGLLAPARPPGVGLEQPRSTGPGATDHDDCDDDCDGHEGDEGDGCRDSGDGGDGGDGGEAGAGHVAADLDAVRGGERRAGPPRPAPVGQGAAVSGGAGSSIRAAVEKQVV
jgi:anti-sigma regulatory factor (Ser/Thr protein kinase)